MLAACGIEVERLCGGEPIVAPTGEGWESGHTYNAAAVRLGPADAALMAGLLGPGVTPPAEGLVAVFYRAQPRYSPGFRSPRSAIGLALFTPTFAPLRRFSEPVLCPTEDPHGYDYDGVEDPRVTRLGEIFYLVYCGYTLLPSGRSAMQVCLARSRDLLHWEKLGPVRGEVNCSANKDGVLFPEPVNGHYLLLHRPMVGDPSRFAIELAISDSPEGEWRNCGPILRSPGHPRCRVSWVGAGSVPLPLGDGRYLVIYHTGNRLREGGRQYNADVAILNLRHFCPERPERIVTHTLERILVPETRYERSTPAHTTDPLHCVFPCGSYREDGYLHLVYGGADAYTLAARVKTEALLARLC
ncbi:MAG: hypothetical protein GX774_20060 [Armatimonadetes bacterium]|jgi:predicted GH43/DUF377 family glycosyl hydrolase|nr:hypothetical protein [Armatimonadota bacterium]